MLRRHHVEEAAMSTEGVEILRSLADAFNARDFERARGLVSDDLVFVDYATGATINGVEGFVEYARGFATAFSDMRLEALSYVGDDRRAAGEFVGRGTHDGPLATPAGTVPATGRTLAAPFVWYAELADGKITRLGDYYDGATFMTQLGLMPEPQAAST
jgi:steroid delta-isomerase-like uncharacterized protein